MLLRSKRNQKTNAYTIRKNNSEVNPHLYTNNLLRNLGNPRDTNSQNPPPPLVGTLKNAHGTFFGECLGNHNQKVVINYLNKTLIPYRHVYHH